MATFSNDFWTPVGYMPGNPIYNGAPPANPPITLNPPIPVIDGEGPFGTGSLNGGSFDGWLNTINDYFMEQVHMNPNPMNFGAIFGPKLLLMAVLSTYRVANRTLSAVDLSALGDGISLTSGTIPDTWGLMEQQLLGFTATTDGAPSFDGYAVFEWDHRDILIRFMGTRLVPFTLDADMNDPIVQSIGFVTDVMRAKRGNEQRVQLKEIPRIAIEFSVAAVDERDAQLLQSILYGWQWRVFGVPFWQDSQRLVVQVNPGASVINLPSTAGYSYEVGGLVFLWRDAHTWEAVSILAVNPTSLTTATIAGTWLANHTVVMPMKLGRLSTKEDIMWEDVDVATARLRFSMEATEL